MQLIHADRRYHPDAFLPYLVQKPLIAAPTPTKPVHSSAGAEHRNNGARHFDPTDEQVIDKVLSTPKYARAWNGDDSGYPSGSEADLGLCSGIVFYCGPTATAAQVERIFGQSGRTREKWHERADYRHDTITRALNQRDYYNWNGNGKRSATTTPTTPVTRDDKGELDLREVAKLNTDVGNGARFCLRHGDNLRYCYATGKWYYWTGTRWLADETGRIAKLAQQTALAIYDEAKAETDDAKRRRLAEWGTKSQKRERISAMIELAKPHLSITTAQLDADPWLLNCLNYTVDLRTGEARPHCREDYLTKVCRANYDAAATAPVFTAFLARIFRTHPTLIRYVQKALGYAATGLNTEQVLFFLFGTGANGKTTLLDAVQHVLDDYAGKADRDLLAARDGAVHPTNIADLRGRRLVVCSESNEGGRFDEAKLKDLVGETRLKARFMRQDFFEFNATHKVFLYSNHKPLVRGTDFGFWRRIRMIPFIETITDEEKDTDLTQKLQAEADGVLTWLVTGCLLWRAEGLGLPDEVAQATDGYRREMDSIGAFLTESCRFDPKMTATAGDLYRSYTAWCEDNGEKPLSQKRLGMQLAERRMVSDRDGYSGRKIWRGIELKAAPQSAEAGI